MNAIEKVREQIKNLGRYDSPDVLPFEVVESDHSYDVTKWGHLERFVLKVEIVEHTQTPRSEYVEILCELTNDGIEDPRDWVLHSVEKKTVTKIEYIRPKK